MGKNIRYHQYHLVLIIMKWLGSKNEKYPALTGVRAVGASVVFFDHFPFAPQSHIIINVLSFFFVLSGFLITRIYYQDTRPFSKGFSSYFVNRFARIYPVYFLLLTLAVCIHGPYFSLVLLKNYTLTHALFYDYSSFIIQPSWSLTVEECFYFLAPLILFITRKYGLLALFAALTFLLGIALDCSLLPVSFLHTPTFVLSTTFFGHYAEFFAGICLAMIIMKKEKEGKLQNKVVRSHFGASQVLYCLSWLCNMYMHSQSPIIITSSLSITSLSHYP